MTNRLTASAPGANPVVVPDAGRVPGVAWLCLALALLLAAAVFAIVRGGWRWDDARGGTTPPASGPRGGAGAGAIGTDPSDMASLYDVRDVKPLSAPEAIAINAAVPTVPAVGPRPRPFVLNLSRAALHANALQCLTSALYYEAGSETDDGQRAVAQVILNRMRHPTYPASVCGVVYQGSTRATGCQFTFTCDGSLMRTPSTSGWARSRKLAEEALSGRVYTPIGHATHYHADYVVPYWAASLTKTATIGRHIFYRWPGRNGTATAFRQPYAQTEEAPPTIARAAPTEESPPIIEAIVPEADALADARLAAPTVAPAANDGPARSPAPVAEDKRVPPSLAADRAAGTLKLPSGRATASVAMRQPPTEDASCLVNKRAAPVGAGRDARVSKPLSTVSATCS